jgi:hypothetical protein
LAGLAAAGWGLVGLAGLAKCFVKQVLGAGLECVYHQLAKDLVGGAKDLVDGAARE